MSQIIPLENRILVEPVDDSLKSDIRRTETEEKKRPQKGRVLAVGKEYTGILKKGDLVYYEKFEVTELEIEKRV